MGSARWWLPEPVLKQLRDVVFVVVDNLHEHFDVPVHQTHHCEVIVVLSERVVQSCRHIEPSHVEEELIAEEEWDENYLKGKKAGRVEDIQSTCDLGKQSLLQI